MQNAFAFGLAKNVNGLPGARRAATAYQIGGRLSSPTTPVNAENGAWNSGDEAVEEGATIPRVASSPIAFADLGRSHAEHAASVDREAASTGDELHLKRGTSVDKTNPFIGYFQTGTDQENELASASAANETNALPSPMPSPPLPPMRRVPCRTQSSATLSSTSSSFYPSVFFKPQTKMPEWLGFPTLFNKHVGAGESKQKQKQDEEKKRTAFLGSLKLEMPAVALQSTTDDREGQEKLGLKTSAFKRTNSMPASAPTTMTAAAKTAAPALRSPSEQKMATLPSSSSSSSSSRFEQDFEVVGSLGEGGQGAVFKVRSKVDGCYYAIKKVVLPRATELDSQRAENQALREVRSMASMATHANVVRYHTAWTEVDPNVEVSSSTTSLRGSDVPSLDSSCGQEDIHRQQLQLLDEEEEMRMSGQDIADQSFSLDFSSDSINFDQYSTPGFRFEDESESVGLSFDDEVSFGRPGELTNEAAASSVASAEPTALKSQVNLYIQMELCGTAVNSSPSSPRSVTGPRDDSQEPFHRFLDQLNVPQPVRQQTAEEVHTNLAVWLRSSLEERLSWSRTSPKHLEGLKLFLGAVQGVAHMHSYGVIHRDLKPDNIFIHGDVAKIGDFGLSKSVFADSSADGESGMRSPRDRLQETGRSGDEYGDHTTALGTFTYASPEQLGYRFSSSNALKNAASRLKSAKYSIKSDIFALGVILLELCCPFSTMMERSQVLTGVRHGVVPQKARQQFPTEMELVLRMTAIDPAERPTSEEVCEQIRKLLAASSAVVTPQSALEELRDLQLKLAAAVRQVRDRSQATLLLESLVSELNDKVQNVGVAFA
ncbi:hypothetical protein BBJ28_00000392 [Nothophytophthora sp. Chile5]|nr:hypothetical protein BBJ28_00000392 [Nothophytophthora sp. Chile5]